MLGTESGSSVRTASTHNHWALAVAWNTLKNSRLQLRSLCGAGVLPCGAGGASLKDLDTGSISGNLSLRNNGSENTIDFHFSVICSCEHL